MAVDALLPAASEVVMVYAGAVAAGAFAGQSVVLVGQRIGSGFWAYLAIALAGWGLGSSYERFHHDFRFADYAIALAVVGAVAYLLLRRRARARGRASSRLTPP